MKLSAFKSQCWGEYVLYVIRDYPGYNADGSHPPNLMFDELPDSSLIYNPNIK